MAFSLSEALNEGTPTPSAPAFSPTEEQAAIIEAAATTSDNLLINALAGAAKTSTLVMVANDRRLANTSILALAFNKRIADELKGRLPPNCVPMTLNSLGHRVWSAHIARRCRPDTRKNYNILKSIIDAQPKDRKEYYFENFAELLKLMAFAKSAGFVPESCGRPAPLALWETDDEFFSHLAEEPTPLDCDILVEALNESITLSFAGEIDFDDQIYMPTVYGAKFPTYPLTMIDEAQDLSNLNHHMLAAIVGDRRLCAVGDNCQAIYGFRGAHEDSMELLRRRFSMHTLDLSISFRCPKAVVKTAQWRAPHMRFPDWAKEGKVTHLSSWSVDNLPTAAAILCRNNAPLYRMAIRLLLNGRFAKLVGNDIGKQLIKVMKKMGPGTATPSEVAEAINTYEEKRLLRTREGARDGVRDFCQCLRIFMSHGDTLSDMVAYGEHLINMEGPLQLMTIHKSKGLEFNDVFILDQQLINFDRGGQEKNILYVAQTRSMDNLTYIESAGFVGEDMEDQNV